MEGGREGEKTLAPPRCRPGQPSASGGGGRRVDRQRQGPTLAHSSFRNNDAACLVVWVPCPVSVDALGLSLRSRFLSFRPLCMHASAGIRGPLPDRMPRPGEDTGFLFQPTHLRDFMSFIMHITLAGLAYDPRVSIRPPAGVARKAHRRRLHENVLWRGRRAVHPHLGREAP